MISFLDIGIIIDELTRKKVALRVAKKISLKLQKSDH